MAKVYILKKTSDLRVDGPHAGAAGLLHHSGQLLVLFEGLQHTGLVPLGTRLFDDQDAESSMGRELKVHW